MFVVKINDAKGTVTVCDVPLTTKSFQVDGFTATTSNGEKPSKFGWFRLQDFQSKIEEIKSHFAMGKDLTKFIEFGKVSNAEMKLFHIVPVKHKA